MIKFNNTKIKNLKIASIKNINDKRGFLEDYSVKRFLEKILKIFLK